MAMPPLDLTTEADHGLFAACQEVARAVLWRSGGDSSDVVETQAAKYFAIARDHQDFVRGQRDDDMVIENDVRYLARVHAIPPMGTDTFWFSNSLSVLIELAVPNSGLDEISAAVMPDLQVGIIQALERFPFREMKSDSRRTTQKPSTASPTPPPNTASRSACSSC